MDEIYIIIIDTEFDDLCTIKETWIDAIYKNPDDAIQYISEYINEYGIDGDLEKTLKEGWPYEIETHNDDNTWVADRAYIHMEVHEVK